MKEQQRRIEVVEGCLKIPAEKRGAIKEIISAYLDDINRIWSQERWVSYKGFKIYLEDLYLRIAVINESSFHSCDLRKVPKVYFRKIMKRRFFLKYKPYWMITETHNFSKELDELLEKYVEEKYKSEGDYISPENLKQFINDLLYFPEIIGIIAHCIRIKSEKSDFLSLLTRKGLKSEKLSGLVTYKDKNSNEIFIEMY